MLRKNSFTDWPGSALYFLSFLLLTTQDAPRQKYVNTQRSHSPLAFLRDTVPKSMRHTEKRVLPRAYHSRLKIRHSSHFQATYFKEVGEKFCERNRNEKAGVWEQEFKKSSDVLPVDVHVLTSCCLILVPILVCFLPWCSVFYFLFLLIFTRGCVF